MQPSTPTNPPTTARAARGLGLIAALALAVSTIALLKPTADASSAARAAPSAVATVDLFAVINALDEFTAREQSLARSTQERRDEVQRLNAEIEGLEQDLTGLDPTSDAYDQLFRERNMKAGFRELRVNMLTKWQMEDNARLISELYAKAITAVGEVAQRDGWDVVVHRGQPMAVPPNPNIRAELALDFVEDWIQSRRVIYANDAVDITNSVVQHMNNKYAAGG
jgi:Skp family chaperone for outer membrane proteins